MKEHKDMNARIDAAAREWFALITSGEATDEDVAVFESWCAESSLNEEAYGTISQIGNELGLLARTEHGENLLRFAEEYQERPTKEGFWAFVKSCFAVPYRALGAATAAAITVAVIISLYLPSEQRYETGISEQRKVQLADGSVLTLGAKTSIEVVIAKDSRTVTMTEGQAFFDIVKDEKRPFLINLDDAKIAVLGTTFDVHLGPDIATVAVLEGRIRVTPKPHGDEPSSHKQKPAILVAGQEVSVSGAGGLNGIRQSQTQAGEWQEGRLAYVEAPLGRILADINRYYDQPIVLQDEQMLATQMTTSFEAGQIDVFLRNLPDMLPVAVVREAGGVVRIKHIENLQ